ncbi:MAG TPA: DUF1877 domain-containing protein [Alphaproteobacteria bacterium]|nr:DUF1877 domain-containing protein [Alphaproteobacteria bacterium]HAJ46718.1 DUF1877 domain-containing protein [Alphaproteobacteria bacterium]
MKRSLRKQLEQLNKVKAACAAPPGSAGAADIPSPDAMVDLHKSWHVLHYLLTGTADGGSAPLNLLMTGGEDIGDDVGYGPARVWNAATVQAFADAVRGLSVEDLMARADYARMLEAQIYSCDEADDDPEMALMELQETVEHYFPALQAFVTKAAKERACALVWMS